MMGELEMKVTATSDSKVPDELGHRRGETDINWVFILRGNKEIYCCFYSVKDGRRCILHHLHLSHPFWMTGPDLS